MTNHVRSITQTVSVNYIVPCDDGQIVSSRGLSATFHICYVWKCKTFFLEFREQQFDQLVFESCTWSLSMCQHIVDSLHRSDLSVMPAVWTEKNVWPIVA